jgi:PIN domain nuclease of toxin-antitoxin system
MGSPAGLKLLLDTHVWLWRLREPERLSQAAEAAIANRDNELFLSPVSVWEAMVLARKGRLKFPQSPREWMLDVLRRSPLIAAPITHEIALHSETLDSFDSQDPADRFLVATALEDDLAVVTADKAFHAFEPVATVW